MAAKSILTWSTFLVIYFICPPFCAQDLGLGPYQGLGICKGVYCKSIKCLESLKDCVVVTGNIYFLLLEQTKQENFINVTFPKLREVSGFLLLYRVRGLQSVGQLFPNLARIRGNDVYGNFGLVVHDLANLVEIGLYSLVKIDRGAVEVGRCSACFVDTVDWAAIAPRPRHALSPAPAARCPRRCRCGPHPHLNHCWNDRICQRFVSGPRAEECHEQCLGCRRGSRSSCAVCRHRTHRGRCVPACPPDTLVLHEVEYCVSRGECEALGGRAWRAGCVLRCPVGTAPRDADPAAGGRTCEPCDHCDKTCGSLMLTTLASLQAAEACVVVRGALTMHVRAVREAMHEAARFLSRIQLVTGYVAVYGSHTITSLDFLSSLRKIEGRQLKDNRYSLVVHGMTNLTSLFSENVTNNLVIERGTLNFYDNPVLCTSNIKKISKLFPIEPGEIDVPKGMNGYSGSCKEMSIALEVSISNETTATVRFFPVSNANAHYTVLFAKVPALELAAQAPESCSLSDWSTLSVNTSNRFVFNVQLHNLRPSSKYAVCVEIYNPLRRNLARSSVVYFNTPIGKPAPPFISELFAFSDDAVDIVWSVHQDYRSYITHYKLDVTLIEIESRNIAVKNYCRHHEAEEYEPTRHRVMARPPAQYSACGHADCPDAASHLDNSDAWLGYDIANDYDEHELETNSSYADYIPTTVINIKVPKLDYRIRGLAPYRDYRLRLRACTNQSCSISTQSVIRTLRSYEADIALNITAYVDQMAVLLVTWEPPNVVNGAILAYFIQAKLKRGENDVGYPVPSVWCVSSNRHQIKERVAASGAYLVRVCSWSLAAERACSGWAPAGGAGDPGGAGHAGHAGGENWWCVGVFVGTALWLLSVIASRFWIQKPILSDEIPLTESTSMYRSYTDPPNISASDFEPIYLIPMRNEFFDQ